MLQSQSSADTSSLVSSLDNLNLEFVAAGKSGIVYKIDDEKVVKQYTDSNDSDVERRAYERLDSHPNVARYLGSMKDGSIILERGQVLRMVFQQTGPDQIPLRRKLRWLRHAAEGLRYIHEKGIVQADVGCQNMILTRDDCLKIIDFEGCSIDGEEASSCYEWFSYRRSTPSVSQQTDIFAYGCVVYEILTGRPPHHDLGASDERARLVERRYQQNQFPDIRHLPLGELMRSCWHSNFNSMSEVIQALEAASLLSSNAKFGATITRALKSGCCFK